MNFQKIHQDEKNNMNFQKKYQKEMDGIQRTEELKALASENMYQHRETVHKKQHWQAAVAVVAICFVIVAAVNSNKVVSFAKSLFGSFTLSTGKITMDLDDVVPVPFDKEAFIADKKTHEFDNCNYVQLFETYEEMTQKTGLKLPKAESLEYKNISLAIDTENSYGHISVEICLNGYNFEANGMFGIDGFQQENWGYGTKEIPEEIYEYADGKKAYFINSEEVNRVYFSEGNILFQMAIEKADDAKLQAKQVIDIMAN